MMMQSGSPVRWAVDISQWQPDQFEWQNLLRLLPVELAAEVNKYRQTGDQQRAVISRLLQRKVINTSLSIPWSEVQIRRTRGGKPFCSNAVSIASLPNFNYNVSHEGDYVVLAAESSLICGVDVAAPPQTRSTRLQTATDLHRAFDKQLTTQEWYCVESGGDTAAQMRLFQIFWSLKEAFVKARGDGLGFDLGKAEFCLSTVQTGLQTATVSVDGHTLTRWKFHIHSLGQGHIVSVALGPPEDVVDAWGEFKGTFSRPNMNATEMQDALAVTEPAFTLLEVPDLLP